MNIELIMIGNELVSGEIADANAFFMANALTERGFSVTRVSMVGDQEGQIQDALLQSRDRAEAVIVSGGLGPTSDDLTTPAAAKAFGESLVLHEESLEQIRERFARGGMEMPRSNEKQAVFPASAEIIPNPVGTAPGFCLKSRGKAIFFLPGVPRELQHLFRETVLPRLERERKGNSHYRARTLKIFGLTESAIADRLSGIRAEHFSATLAYLPRYPENHVKIIVQGSDLEEVKRNLAELERVIREKLEGRVFAVDRETLEEIVGRLLKERQATLAVAESCTGGLVAHRMTNIPGSSEYFERGVVVYSNQAKTELLQVPKELLAELGAVSAPVAEKMAEGVRHLSRATIGLAITGIAGPAGGSADKPVGTVFIALSGPDGTASRRYQFWGDRDQVKMISAQTALEWVRRYFLFKGVAGLRR
ncbi:MAG: competence/damage-inducible protein A [Deltaproteobacteria bacterium]|nr:competence/damage-inducible protein A [Deltaproteobacteria bacterium]